MTRVRNCGRSTVVIDGILLKSGQDALVSDQSAQEAIEDFRYVVVVL